MIAGAACGGDTLFIEACLKRDMQVEILLPFEEGEYTQRSLVYAGGDWAVRFHNLRNHPKA